MSPITATPRHRASTSGDDVQSPSYRRKTSPADVILVLSCVLLLSDALLPSGSAQHQQAVKNIAVSVRSCSVTGSTPSIAEVLYTVSNYGSEPTGVTLEVKYRNSGGRLVGSDMDLLPRVPAGNGLQAGKSTELHRPTRSVNCHVTVRTD